MVGFKSPYVEGEQVTLTCYVSEDNPTASIQWYRNGIPTVTTKDYTFQANRNDDGVEYRCEEDNGVNKLSAANSLEVACEFIFLDKHSMLPPFLIII